MDLAQLALANEHVSLSVRSFVVHDGISQLFDVRVVAGSSDPDLDLESILGQPAALRLATGQAALPYAVWSGICADIDQIGVEEDGLSIYALSIVPMLWRALQRTNRRIFQDVTGVDAACRLLDEWEIERALRLEATNLARHEYRVQHGESDYAFVARMLEEAGVSYLFEQIDPKGGEKDQDPLPAMRLVLADSPHLSGQQRGEPLPYIGNTEDIPNTPFAKRVRIGGSVRPGRVAVLGYDPRVGTAVKLAGDAQVEHALESRYEQFLYHPPVFARAGEQVSAANGQTEAALALGALRQRRREITLETNQLDVAPGVIFRIDGHPRADLNVPLLTVERRIEGTIHSEWDIDLHAIRASDGFRPARRTAKPRVMGLQSAIVVGPGDEEIHTDSLGRVKVQFFWDRYGNGDPESSCWIRPSQPWAGSGYGLSFIPRVGHEVLVGFYEGDPDQPVIVGRGYHRGAQPPDELPKKKTKSTWRSASTPGGEGYNEISMDDAKGEELLYVRAERNLESIVIADQKEAIGRSLETSIRRDEIHKVGGNQQITVEADRSLQVNGNLSVSARAGMQTQTGNTGIHSENGKLVISNGTVSIVLDGPNLTFDVTGSMRLRAARVLSLSGKQVTVDGDPDVLINSGEHVPPEVEVLPVVQYSTTIAHPSEGQVEAPAQLSSALAPVTPGGLEEAEFDGYQYLKGMLEGHLPAKVKLPKKIVLPPHINKQIERFANITEKGKVVKGKLLDPETYHAMEERLKRRIDAEKARLKKFGRDLHGTFERQRGHYDRLGDELGDRLAAEKAHLGELRQELGAIFSGEKGNLIESAKALGKVVKDQAKHIKQLKQDITGMIQSEIETFESFKEEWLGHYDEVKGYLEEAKDLVNNPKDEILEIILGEDKQLGKDIADLAEEFGYGDEVSDFLGLDSGGGGEGGLPDMGGGVPDPGGLPSGSKVKKLNAGRGHDSLDFSKKNWRKSPDGNGMGGRFAEGTKGPMQQGGLGGAAGKSVGSASGLGNHQGGVPMATKKAGAGGAPSLGGPDRLAAHGGGADRLAAHGGGADRVAAHAGGADRLASHAKGAQGPAGQLGAGGQLGGSSSQGVATAVSRNGALTAGDLATSSATTASLVQSPGEGQLLVMPTNAAQPVDAASLQSAMVAAQMDGQPVNGAIHSSLDAQGYAVYERPWGDWTGEFVRAGSQAAAKA